MPTPTRQDQPLEQPDLNDICVKTVGEGVRVGGNQDSEFRCKLSKYPLTPSNVRNWSKMVKVKISKHQIEENP